MRYKPLPAQFYIRNREKLARLLKPNSLAVIVGNEPMPTSADGVFPLHPCPDLFYLTGIEQEQTILLLAPDAPDVRYREVIFLRRVDEKVITWEGEKLSPSKVTEISGIANVKWLDEFESVFHQLMCWAENVYLNINEHKRAILKIQTPQMRFVKWCKERYPLHNYLRLAPLLYKLRIVKEPEEIEQIKKAIEITKKGFLRVLRYIRPCVKEMEIEAEYAHEFIRSGAKFAYPPIIASGPRACVLHYTSNDGVCEDGQLVLLDVAASYGNYNADLTRTVPVNGSFTPRQRQIYEAVLRVQRKLIDGAQPGKLYRQWQKEAEQIIAQELVSLGLLSKEEAQILEGENPPFKRYFMHGVGHPLGLDVHDVGILEEPFQPGWVFTVEPAIYIKEEGIGIRLENIILITDKGPIDLTSDIPIEPDEIETLMGLAIKE